MVLLIADDEAVIRKGLSSLNWKSIGISKILAAKNGLEAIEILENQHVDIVLSDIRMPGATGVEVSEYIYKNSIDVSVIFLTGFSDFEYAKKAIQFNVVDYILKPVKPKDVIDVVLKAKIDLEQKRYQQKIIYKYKEKVKADNIPEHIINCFDSINLQVKKILVYMIHNHNANISLNILSEHFHLTSTYISRLIKKETGFSFCDILTSIRLMYATELLKKDDDKICIICEKVGFYDQRYFSQVFKRVFGLTPSEYKKEPMELTFNEILTIL